jgi:DNA-binding response OmpR family regulator
MMHSEGGEILIVEDDRTSCQTLALAVREKKLTVDVAADAFEARRMLARHNYRVVLLDLVLPDGNGSELVEFIKSQEQPWPTVIVITGAPKEMVATLDRGVIQTVLMKPIDLKQLAAYL